MERICLLPEHTLVDLVKYVKIFFFHYYDSFIVHILYYLDMHFGCWSVLMTQVDVMQLCSLVTVFTLGLFKRYLITMMDYANLLMW